MNPTPAPQNQKKILVVDDNKVILSTMSVMLRAGGYHVVLAETGADALASLRRNKPDLILLDLDFPPDLGNLGASLRDGMLILDWARRMCDAGKIPVIIVSALDPEVYKAKAQAAGISTCFRKPVDKDKLLAAIHALLDAPPTA